METLVLLTKDELNLILDSLESKLDRSVDGERHIQRVEKLIAYLEDKKSKAQ